MSVSWGETEGAPWCEYLNVVKEKDLQEHISSLVTEPSKTFTDCKSYDFFSHFGQNLL